MFCKLQEGQNLNGLLVEYWTQEGPTLAVSVMTAYLSRQRTQIEALTQHVWYLLKKFTICITRQSGLSFRGCRVQENAHIVKVHFVRPDGPWGF